MPRRRGQSQRRERERGITDKVCCLALKGTCIWCEGLVFLSDPQGLISVSVDSTKSRGFTLEYSTPCMVSLIDDARILPAAGNQINR